MEIMVIGRGLSATVSISVWILVTVLHSVVL